MAQSKAAKRLERVSSLTLDMEEPLNEAMHLTLVRLRLMGEGLAAHGDCGQGRAVAEVAVAVGWYRLDTLKAVFDRTHKDGSWLTLTS